MAQLYQLTLLYPDDYDIYLLSRHENFSKTVKDVIRGYIQSKPVWITYPAFEDLEMKNRINISLTSADMDIVRFLHRVPAGGANRIIKTLIRGAYDFCGIDAYLDSIPATELSGEKMQSVCMALGRQLLLRSRAASVEEAYGLLFDVVVETVDGMLRQPAKQPARRQRPSARKPTKNYTNTQTNLAPPRPTGQHDDVGDSDTAALTNLF